MATILFTNLRVYVEESVHPIYGELTNRAIDSAEDVPFVKMPDLFIAAACVGAKENQYRELIGKKKDIFLADAFDTALHIPLLLALAYKKLQNVDALSDPKIMLNICQGWANGGIRILRDQVNTGKGLRPLYNLIDFVSQFSDKSDSP